MRFGVPLVAPTILSVPDTAQTGMSVPPIQQEEFEMNTNLTRTVLVPTIASLVLFAVGGCGNEPARTDAPKSKPVQVAENQGDHDHNSWWCDEHGVPEGVCGQCNAKVAAELKKKGDWCKEHDRPNSQCFICHPELKERFAAQYRAKYGKEPPPIHEG
jgi:cobalt-zinc-cadmium efflux system membrane fusion protein